MNQGGYRMNYRTIRIYLIILLGWPGLFYCTGCGSGDAPEETELRVPEKKEQPKTVSIPKSRKKIDEEKKEEKKVSKPELKANPEDIYVVTEPVPNYQILETDPDSANKVSVIPPDDEYGLSSYRIINYRKSQPKVKKSNVKLPEGFSPLPEFGYAEDGMPLRIYCEVDESELAYIAPGVGVLGSEDGPPETTPKIAVELDAFYIDVTEVTVGQFKNFLDKNFSSGVKEEQSNLDSPDDYPVLGVKWFEAKKYCNWTGKDLPTEAEWERAARGIAGYIHVWGNGRPTWSQSRKTDQITPVQTYPTDKTEQGIFDLAGNAMEWCEDYYHSRAYQEAFSSAAGTVLKNWEGPNKAEVRRTRVVKGNGPDWKAWNRRGGSQDDRSPQIGFRCVLRLSGKSKSNDEET